MKQVWWSMCMRAFEDIANNCLLQGVVLLFIDSIFLMELIWSIHSVLRLTCLPGERLPPVVSRTGRHMLRIRSIILTWLCFPIIVGKGLLVNSVCQHLSCEPKHLTVQLKVWIRVYLLTVSQSVQPQTIFSNTIFSLGRWGFIFTNQWSAFFEGHPAPPSAQAAAPQSNATSFPFVHVILSVYVIIIYQGTLLSFRSVTRFNVSNIKSSLIDLLNLVHS